MGGFFGALTIVFVVAKLTGFIDWSWLVVFSPLAIGAVVAIIAGVLAAFSDSGW